MEKVYPEIWVWMKGGVEYDGKIYDSGREVCPEGAFKANELGVYVITDDSNVYGNGTKH